MIRAVYPGSFDPITLGHLDIIKRSLSIFDELIVCVMVNSGKSTLFTIEERLEMIRKTVTQYPNVKIESSQELLVDFMNRMDAKIVVKGLRAVSDYEWELQMALVNKKLAPNIETLLMPASEEYTYLSSSIVKEVANYGVNLEAFVPNEIIDDILKKM
ncbi:MAG: pantetheine-phosphate adenylyltransferase [Oscillospiraceae bacterium]|nr:pantetheine-phosphate adenylyltransferase [Oscillospiraceae bacterium]